MTIDFDDNSDPYALLQQFLDILSQEPGAILYRGPDMWEALHPGDPGSLLVLSDERLPIWEPPT